MLHRCRVALSFALTVAVMAQPTRAQQDPIQDLLKLVPAAQGQPEDSEAVKKLEAALQHLTDLSTKLSRVQYRQAAQYLLHGQMPARAGHVVYRALEIFENDPELLELLGMTEFSQCQTVNTDADMRLHARKAVTAFKRARDAGATTPTCRLLPWQAHIIDCRFDEALAAIEALIADKKLQQMMPDRHLARGMALLGLGRYQEALAELTHKDMPMRVRMGSETMATRAEAMAGMKDAAIKRSKAKLARGKAPMTVALHADTLAFAGKYDEALKLLQDNPVTAMQGEPELRLAQRKQSRAAFEFLISLRGKAPKDLHVQLAKHLGHAAIATGADSDGMTGSPLLLAYTIRLAPSGPKGWGNDLLALACLVAAADYKPSELENKVITTMYDKATVKALRGPKAKERAVQLLRALCMRDDYEGSLVALQLGLQL